MAIRHLEKVSALQQDDCYVHGDTPFRNCGNCHAAIGPGSWRYAI